MEIWGGLGAVGNPEELWSTLKMTILDVASACYGTHHQVKRNFGSEGALNTIDQSHRARFNDRPELFRELRHKTVHVLRADKEANVGGICEGV